MSEEKGLTKEEMLKALEENKTMTPQEKLHATLFFHETYLVKDMADLKLDAHIEKLSEVCFHGRARLDAAVAERNKRKVKPKQGFESSPVVTNTLNIIKEKRLSRKEQLKKDLEKIYGIMGNPDAAKDAAAAVSARNMDGVVNRVQDKRSPIAESFAKNAEKKQIDNAIESILGFKPPPEETKMTPKSNYNPFKKDKS